MKIHVGWFIKQFQNAIFHLIDHYSVRRYGALVTFGSYFDSKVVIFYCTVSVHAIGLFIYNFIRLKGSIQDTKTYNTKHTTIKRLLQPIHIGSFVYRNWDTHWACSEIRSMLLRSATVPLFYDKKNCIVALRSTLERISEHAHYMLTYALVYNRLKSWVHSVTRHIIVHR